MRLAEGDEVREIDDINDVIVEFLAFMLRSAQVEFAVVMGLELFGYLRQEGQTNALVEIFAHEMQVAASVPAAWPAVVQDRFVILLHRAGFPTSTAIVPEAASAAIHYFNKTARLEEEEAEDLLSEEEDVEDLLAEEEDLETLLSEEEDVEDPLSEDEVVEDLLVTDIGGSTIEGLGVRRYFENGKQRCVQTVPPAGSFDGSLKLNTILEKQVRAKASRELQSFVKSLGLTQKEFFRRLKDGFEVGKQEFDNVRAEWRVKFPIPSNIDTTKVCIPSALKSHMIFHPDEQCFDFSREMKKDVFDEWLPYVVAFVLAMLDNYWEVCPDGSPRVALSGWGSLAPYVLEGCRDLLGKAEANVDVECIEDTEQPSIAQGAYIILRCEDLFCDRVARTSHGIGHDIRLQDVPRDAEYRELDEKRSTDGTLLLDRIEWIVKKGTNLSDPLEPFIFEGTKRLEVKKKGNRFPVDWDIDIFVSGHDDVTGIDKYRPAKNTVDDGQVCEVPGLSVKFYGNDCGFRTVESSETMSIIEFDFRVRVRLDKLLPILIVSIPREEEFQSPIGPGWTEETEECLTHEIPLAHLCTHATMRGVKEAQQAAGWPVQIDEKPEAGFYSDGMEWVRS